MRLIIKNLNKKGRDLKMVDKQFLILNENEDETILEQKMIEFIKITFGELFLDKISISVYGYALIEPDYKEGLNVEIEFKDYKYFDNLYKECIELIEISLEDKGLKPFYIGGKFISRHVFEWIQGNRIQKAKMIYGIDKDKLYKDFGNFMLTC